MNRDVLRWAKECARRLECVRLARLPESMSEGAAKLVAAEVTRRTFAPTNPPESASSRRRLQFSDRLLSSSADAFEGRHNPKGIASQSPGLRGTSYPGFLWATRPTLKGLRPRCVPGWTQPRWGCDRNQRPPRVVAALQPWALGRNPVGIHVCSHATMRIRSRLQAPHLSSASGGESAFGCSASKRDYKP